jgi:hypothetical protein
MRTLALDLASCCSRGVLSGFLQRYTVKTVGSVLATLTLCGWCADAAGQSGRPPLGDLHNCRLTLEARQALLEDKTLAALNVGVSVRNGTATLWGPIASQELARRAAQAVRKVQGIVDVRSDLRIEPVAPAMDFVVLPVAEPPSRQAEPLREVARRWPGELLARPGDSRWLTDSQPRQREEWTAPREAVPIMPSLVVPSPPPVPAPGSPGASSLLIQIDQLRQRDARYRDIRLQVRGGVVHLSGTVYRGDDVYEFARAVARLPGVARVLVDDIRVAPASP